MEGAGAWDDNSKPAISPRVLHTARRALRHYKLFLLVLMLGIGATALVAKNTPQVYRSEAVILYRQSARQGAGDASSWRRVGSRLQDMLVARERLLRIVRELRPYPKAAGPYEAADELRRKIGFLARDGSTFLIWFDTDTPARAQTVTARLAQTLIEDVGRQQADEAEQTRQFLDTEKQRVEREVRDKEMALSRFIGTHPEAVQARIGGGWASGSSSTPDSDSPRREALAPRRESPSATRADADLLSAERRAALELLQAQRDLEAKQQALTDAHPDLINARERLRQAEVTLARTRAAGVTSPAPATPAAPTLAAGSSTASGTPNRVDVGREIAALERELTHVRRSARRGGPRPSPHALRGEVELQSLRHDLEQARERLAGLEDRQFQAALTAKMESRGDIGSLALLDPAYLPGLPLVDRKKKTTMAGVAIAFLLAASAALLRAHTDDRLYDVQDVVWLAGLPVLADVPAISRKAHG